MLESHREEAAAHFREAVRLDPHSKTARENLEKALKSEPFRPSLPRSVLPLDARIMP